MTLSAGTKLGPYEILAPLGAGGMGEVYRAKDPRLGREVAIKVLPASFAQDKDRLARFEAEARAASALNHPNIITIHEIGAANGTSYIAMEFVDGTSLRELLASGALPTKRLLDVAVQIAEGLAKAHSAGIVHRDLKPENVMVSKDGFVKLLDFGLAKLFLAPTDQATHAPTAIHQETAPGTVMGTVGYMSPEQASGRPVDFRSDQFALGSILYEMATGQRAFQKGTGAQTLAAIIQDEPEPVAQVNPKAPAPFRWIVERCHAKDPDERYASTRDLARDLKSVREHLGEVAGSSSGAAVVAPPARRRSRLGLWVAAGVIAAAFAGVLAGRRIAGVGQPRFQRLTFQRGTVISARFGPDGQTVYYSAAWEGGSPRISLLRPGNPESSALPLPPANLLGISANGEFALQLDAVPSSLGFGYTGTLARAPVSGGAPKELLRDVSYADWAPGGADLAVVHRVAGKDRLEYPAGHVLYETAGWIQGPRFSPDGRLIAFIDHPGFGDDGRIALVDRSGKKTNLAGDFATVQGLAWAAGGREVWFTAAREGIEREIFAVSPAGKLRLLRTLQGTPALLDLVGSSALITEDDYRAGVLAFLPGQSTARDLGWFDWSSARALSADGKLMLFDETGEGGGATGAAYLRSTDGAPAVRMADGLAMALSPDGAWAMTRSETNGSHLALVPVKAGQIREFPPDGLLRSGYGAFFPDGSRFVFATSAPDRGARLFVQKVSGGAPTPITPEGVTPSPIAVSPDGRFVAGLGTDARVTLFSTDGGKVVSLPAAQANDVPAGWTSDGKGVYVSTAGIVCRIDLIDVASGRRSHVRDLAGPDTAGIVAFGSARVTPDGAAMTASFSRVLSILYRVTELR